VVEIAIVADSLVNLQQDLSPEDRHTVDRQVRSPAVLHVERYPEIRFRAERLQVEIQAAEGDGGRITGVLHGMLTVRDRTRPAALRVQARWTPQGLQATGRTEFLQSDFGIEPYRRFLGAVAVADRLRVDLDIHAVPAPQ
jgi:polyisoprenoid-binding protein YceI